MSVTVPGVPRREPRHSKRFSSRAGGYRALTVLAGATGLFCFAHLSAAPQTVIDIGPQSPEDPVAVLQGVLYTRVRASDANGLVIRARRLDGGAQRTLLQAGGFPRMGSVRITMDGIAYGHRGYESNSRSAPPGAQPPAATALPPPGRQLWRPMRRARLWLAPLSGGPARELIPDRLAREIHLAGGYCYWVDDERLHLKTPVLKPLAASPRALLYATPIGGGTTRRIATLPPSALVQPGVNGVFWGETIAPNRQVLHAQPPDFAPTMLDDASIRLIPLEVGERFYWMDTVAAGSDLQSTRFRLLSATREGGSPQLLLDTGSEAAELQLSLLGAARDGLLLRRTRTRGRGADDIASLDYAVLRYHPGRKNPLEKVMDGQHARTASVIAVDQGFLYYTAQETRENWLDWSPDGLAPQVVSRLYRLRLRGTPRP